MARQWSDDFPGSFYVEIQRLDPLKSAAFVQASVDLAERCALPVVATHPIQFVRPEDFRAHEARVCIAHGYVLGDARRPKEFQPSQYFKTQEEMAELFADLPDALENSVEIARRCAFEFTLGKSRLPIFRRRAGNRSRISCALSPPKGWSVASWSSTPRKAPGARRASAIASASSSR